MAHYTARIVRMQDGFLAGQREFPTPEIAAAHLLMLLTMAGWQGDRDETAATLAEGTPVHFKGFDYRVLKPSVLAALEEEVRKAGERK